MEPIPLRCGFSFFLFFWSRARRDIVLLVGPPKRMNVCQSVVSLRGGGEYSREILRSSCQELRNFLEFAAPQAWEGDSRLLLRVRSSIILHHPGNKRQNVVFILEKNEEGKKKSSR